MRSVCLVASLMSALLACGGSGTGLLECDRNASCDLAGGGLCVSPGTSHRWCAYPDSDCPSGFRFSDVQVGDGVSGQCLADDAGMIDASETPVHDGDTSCRRRVAFDDGVKGQIGVVLREVWASNLDGTGMVNLSNDTLSDDREPDWSPDGVHVVFTSNRLTSGFQQVRYDSIFVVNVDGTNVVSVLEASVLKGQNGSVPRWSPDGTQIAFEHSGKPWVMNSDGSNARQLSTRATMGRAEWSPDSKHIVFPSPSDGVGFPTQYVVNVDAQPPVTTKLTPTSGGVETSVNWKPHLKIFYNSGGDVYSINGDGSGQANVTQAAEDDNHGSVSGADGATLFFSRTAANGADEIWSMPVAGGTRRQLTHQDLVKSTHDFVQDASADGKTIAFFHQLDRGLESEQTQIGIVNSDGTGLSLFNAPAHTRADHAALSSCP